MKREIITTADGSTTIHLPDWNEQYHSKHGAINEAYHVFIHSGLQFTLENHGISRPLCVLEIGLGTGLNAFITYIEAEKHKIDISYVGVEGYPIALEEAEKLNYISELDANDKASVFKMLHSSEWEEPLQLSSHFQLTKQHKMFDKIADIDAYHLIYFDAFGARVQPDLWTEAIFKLMYAALKPKGVLVTYAAKGSVRRAMQSVGFTVERLPGPPGKREMLRGVKL